jgi:hypothetical protein
MRAFVILALFATFSYGVENRDALLLQLQENSINNYNIAVKLCNRAVLYRLDGKPDNKEKPTNIFPRERSGKIWFYYSKEQTVRIDDYDRFRSTFLLLGKNVRGEQMLCHNPGYGIRLYLDQEIIFETTICFECKNWVLPVLQSDDFASLPGGDDDQAILGFFQSYLNE